MPAPPLADVLLQMSVYARLLMLAVVVYFAVRAWRADRGRAILALLFAVAAAASNYLRLVTDERVAGLPAIAATLVACIFVVNALEHRERDPRPGA